MLVWTRYNAPRSFLEAGVSAAVADDTDFGVFAAVKTAAAAVVVDTDNIGSLTAGIRIYYVFY